MNKRTNNSDLIGTESARNFVNLCRSYGVEPKAAPDAADMHDHWDYLVADCKVEVKGRKRLRRGDTSVNDDVIYVEFSNVRGDTGWLYGKADFIAFERPDGFLWVRRSALVTLAETLVSKQWANRPTLYKSYRRNDRPAERVGLIKVTDLQTIENHFYKYK